MAYRGYSSYDAGRRRPGPGWLHALSHLLIDKACVRPCLSSHYGVPGPVFKHGQIPGLAVYRLLLYGS